MIRWEQEDSGDWRGLSGSLTVATVKRDPSDTDERWLWEMRAVKRLPGARASGHRATELEARRAVDSYWSRWLEAAALRPDLEKLAKASVAPTRRKRAS